MNPPGPPGPTPKPLRELEPRIPIYAEQMPMMIVEPGVYYLMENIATDGAGITIDSDHVTIDLMGFTLAGGTGNGITVINSHIWTRVQNGIVQGWDQHGLDLGERSVVRDVLAHSNMGNGIQVAGYSWVVDSVGDANFGHGIVAGFESKIQGCRGTANGENGIWGTVSVHIVNCFANVNTKNGIRVDDYCYVTGSTAQFNDQNEWFDKAGIWVSGDDNRIEGNHLVWNNVGLDIDGNDNIIVKNTISKCRTVAVDIAPGATGNLIETKTDLTTAGPWSNFIK
jgi:parallel beta-helix repeat protein